jgi:outer membrane protein OmpA-like peptidoglycan-associated protein
MKKLLLIVATLSIGFSQAQQQGDPTTHYVVIGAFRILENAIKLSQLASQNGFPAQYAIQPDRNLYYVYVLSEEDKKKAYNAVIKLKVETNYKDAWVYSGRLGKEESVAIELKTEPVKPSAEIKIEEPAHDSVAVAEIAPPKVDSSKIVEAKPKPIEIKKPEGKPFYFQLISEDGKELSGSVELTESKNATQFQSIKSGEIVYLTTPRNKQGTYSALAIAAGYKETSITFSYEETKTGKGAQNESIISIKLPKAKKGDYIDFKKVSFFKNTSVLQPESQDELDGVVNLMKENAKYKIRIHGHCNGKQDRESYLMGTATNFFAMDPSGNKKITISSKELSLARAETVKAYLIQQGIEASRITTKGEGGKIPLYPEGGTLGQYNDRIEIEFEKN